jgi:hypothetical protein
LEFLVVRPITALVIPAGALALGLALSLTLAAPASARDLTLPKTTADQLKAACDKAGGKFSQGESLYGCGTDCAGKPGTDCTVNCSADKKCNAQVIGGRRPRSIADALMKPGRH